MNTKTEETIDVTLKIPVPDEFVDYLTSYDDLFRTGHSGYWAYGYGVDDRRTGKPAWLVYEMSADEGVPTDEEAELAETQYQGGAGLPDHWFVLDREAALKVLAEGVKRFGVDFYEDSDATTMDDAIQLALLGEIRYA